MTGVLIERGSWDSHSRKTTRGPREDTKEADGFLNLEADTDGFSLTDFRGRGACEHPDLGLAASASLRDYILVDPSSKHQLQSFVTAVLGI